MHKVVINACYGGFGLSDEAIKWISERTESGTLKELEVGHCFCRHHPLLVECVETLGANADGYCSELLVKTINSSTYRITEYDGYEGVDVPDDLDWVVING